MSQQYIGTARWGTKRSTTYTGTAGTISQAVSAGVYKIRLLVTTDAYVFVSDGGTAATSSNGAYVPALVPEYVTVTPGQQVSAIQVSSSGTVEFVECL
jgi:hypothetical protein